MSFLAADIDDGLSLSRLQVQLTRLKEKAFHWGSWLLLNAGKLTGAEAMRRDMRQREKRDHGWTGIFSNLGVWEVPDSGSWIFCPAISRVYPVGAGCITMNGRMALTVQLHEALGGDLQTASRLLEAWQQACLQESLHDEVGAVRLAVGAG